MPLTLRKLLALLPAGSGRQWLGLVVFALFVSGLEVVAALLILLLLDLVTASKQAMTIPILGNLRTRFPGVSESHILLVATIIIGGFFVFRACIYVGQSYLQNRASSNAGAVLAGRLLRGYMGAPYVGHLRRNSAELIRNAHESTTLLAQQVFVPGIALVSESLLTAAILLALLATRPLMTLATIAVLGPVVLLILRVVQPHQLAYGEEVQETMKLSLRSITQSLQAVRDIRILGKARVFESEFVGIRFRMARAFYLKAVLLDMPRIILESTLVLFILGYVGVVVAIQSNTQGSIASLGLFGYAALRVLPSLNRITNNLQSLKYSRPLIDNLYADLIASDDTVEDAGRIEPLTFDSEIRFDDVSFLYEDDADFSIRGLQLTVNRGEFIGVIGPTGSGKTTLIDLLIGLLSPTAGQILVDGHDIQTNLGGWYAQIGLVSQSVTLIDDTLRRNIALGIPDDQIDETAVNEAVTVAQLSGFVQDLQLGLDTVVGEQGTRLSGGQRQRVAIARALYRRPQILVFDEGTSALDEDTEAALVESLNELRVDRTLVVVAHRMTTIQDCDRAVLLEDGVLVDQGRLVDVLRRRPSYRPTSARAG